MLHKLFQWWYDKTRSSYGQSYRKIDVRSKREGFDSLFPRFRWRRNEYTHFSLVEKKIVEDAVLAIFMALACWFAYESYHGLLIYDA